MNFVYDILLNFQDKERLVEFFEWNEDDTLLHVKKIPIFRVPSVDIDHFCFSDILVEKEFLNQLYGKTILYKKGKHKFLGCLFCDLNRVVAVEFSSEGGVLARSCLLLDEEAEVIDSAKDCEQVVVPYKVLSLNSSSSFLTRMEEFQRNYLYQEFTFLYENKDIDKLEYLYEEIFGSKQADFSTKYQQLIDDLFKHFDFRYQKLFQIVKLSYLKK